MYFSCVVLTFTDPRSRLSAEKVEAFEHIRCGCVQVPASDTIGDSVVMTITMICKSLSSIAAGQLSFDVAYVGSVGTGWLGSWVHKFTWLWVELRQVRSVS